MFKGKYTRDMEKITPSEDALTKTREKILDSLKHKPHAFRNRQMVALVTCLCLLFGTFAFVIMNSSPPETVSGTENPYVLVPASGKVIPSSASVPLSAGSSYSDIYEKLNSSSPQSYFYYRGLGSFFSDSLMLNGIVAEGALESSSDKSSSSTPDYSDTNNQVAGVHEADIIKTDGRYIYACGNTNPYYGYRYYGFAAENEKATEDTKGRVYILSADNGEIDLVSTVRIRNENDVRYVLTEILLYGDTLILIKSGYKHDAAKVSDESRLFNHSGYYYPIVYITAVEVYDISDRANPVFKNELYQSGSYNSSRMIGSDLYIVTNHYVNQADEDKPESYIPYCSSYGENHLVPSSCIYVAEEMTSAVYTVISGIDVTRPDNHISSASVLGFSGTVYASGDNIYIASYKSNNINYWMESDEISTDNEPPQTKVDGETNLYRFSISDAEVSYTASGSVEGNLINQFAMDEYDGAFRIATTVYEYELPENSYQDYDSKRYYYYRQTTYYNNLYILNEDMNIISAITEIAPEERIYSVRFDGEIGYMVTFRQVDPLFAIDLSDATQPKILSELKIPGFSTYMHPYGEGLLFGFGQHADENTGGIEGLKLSMFNVSDKTDVTEQAVLKLGINYYGSAALNNHKAILVDAQKNIIGFPVNYSKSSNEYYSSNSGYVFYKYENKEFVKLGSIELSDSYKYQGLRGFYIGDYAYIFSENEFIASYDISSFAQKDIHTFK